MSRSHGRRALPRQRGATMAVSVKYSTLMASAMVFTLALAATITIPAASATNPGETSQAEVAAFIRNAQNKKNSQSLNVSGTVSTQDAVRDGSSVLNAAAIKQAEGVYGGSALPATALSIGANMVIAPPNRTGGGDAVVQYAMQFVGKVPYILGGNSPSTGFSCDTFIRYVYGQFGVQLIGNADAEARQGTVIPRSDAVMGDLVYYPHRHIGFYDGNGGIVDDPKPGRDVSNRPIWGNPLFIRLEKIGSS